MNIKTMLLAGAAMCTVVGGPALARAAPHIHFLAQGGGVAVKSPVLRHDAAGATYTFTVSISTSVSTRTDYRKKIDLPGTFFTVTPPCQKQPKVKIRLPVKKTAYAKLGLATETATQTCSAPVVYYGNSYDLTTKSGIGKQDHFSTIYRYSGGHGEKIKLDVEVTVGIEK